MSSVTFGWSYIGRRDINIKQCQCIHTLKIFRVNQSNQSKFISSSSSVHIESFKKSESGEIVTTFEK